MKKILFYTNQFFGQIGGEDMAYAEPQLFEGMHGSANTFGAPLKDIAEIVATIVCGDNFYAENMETGRAFLLEQIKKYQPDLIIAGPAFNAGRFGIACGDVCKTAKEQAGVEAITGLYEENPAVDMFKKDVYILRVAKSAAGIRKAVPLMAGFARKLLTGEPIGTPEDEQYYAKGKRVNIFREKNGAERAVDMLLAKVKGEPYKTELEISTYEKVEPSAPIADLSKAKIALCTTGGMVPMGNPDHMVAATAKFWKEYPVEGDTLESGKWESVHAGFDPVYANNDPNRVAPYDMLKMLEKEGIIGRVYPALISTTGNSTSVADSTRMGQEIAERLVSAGVNGVILTST